jgi:hypothetical protein
MGLYNIAFLIFCVILICIIFIVISKNILTEYGVGLLIGILVIGIIGWDIWVNIQYWEMMRKIDLAYSDTERQILFYKLIKCFGTHP